MWGGGATSREEGSFPTSSIFGKKGSQRNRRSTFYRGGKDSSGEVGGAEGLGLTRGREERGKLYRRRLRGQTKTQTGGCSQAHLCLMFVCSGGVRG